MTPSTRYLLLRSGSEWLDYESSNLELRSSGEFALEDGQQTGWLRTRLLDAGDRSSWYRVEMAAEVPEGTRLLVEVGASATEVEPDTYHRVDSLHFRVGSVVPWVSPPHPDTEPEVPPDRWRFIRVRVVFETLDPGLSPSVEQITLRTAGERYLDNLPAIYANEDAKNDRFLEKMLEWLGTELGARHQDLTDLARRIDPPTARAEDLRWLAGFLGWPWLPPHLSAEQLRELLPRLHDLNQQRGTLNGLVEIVCALLGMRITVTEHFHSRKVWRLGRHALGLQTGLALAPDSLMVPDSSTDCDSPLVVGDAVVGGQGPLDREQYGSPVFANDAFRFTVFVPPGEICCDADKDRLRDLIEREKPAHTDFHLCFLEGLRVGVDSRLEVNAYVGSAYPPKPLGQARLGETSLATSRRGVPPVRIPKSTADSRERKDREETDESR